MFTKVTKRKVKDLDVLIERTLKTMVGLDPFTEEYAELLTYLERLYEIKNKEKKWRISPDTIGTIGGSLLGIITIVGFERAHVLTSKALSYVIKGRV